MLPRRLGVDLDFEHFSVSASLPMTSLERAYRSLAERNLESRLRDHYPSLRPCLKVRVVCPACKAKIYSLTSISRGGELLRVCRKCRHEFPVEV